MTEFSFGITGRRCGAAAAFAPLSRLRQPEHHRNLRLRFHRIAIDEGGLVLPFTNRCHRRARQQRRPADRPHVNDVPRPPDRRVHFHAAFQPPVSCLRRIERFTMRNQSANHHSLRPRVTPARSRRHLDRPLHADRHTRRRADRFVRQIHHKRRAPRLRRVHQDRMSSNSSILAFARGVSAARHHSLSRLLRGRRRRRCRRRLLAWKTRTCRSALGDRARLATCLRSLSLASFAIGAPTFDWCIVSRPRIRPRRFIRRLLRGSRLVPARTRSFLLASFLRVRRGARQLVHGSRRLDARRCRSLHPRLNIRDPWIQRAATHRRTQSKKQRGHYDQQQGYSPRAGFLPSSLDPNLLAAWLCGKHRVLVKSKILARRCCGNVRSCGGLRNHRNSGWRHVGSRFARRGDVPGLGLLRFCHGCMSVARVGLAQPHRFYVFRTSKRILQLAAVLLQGRRYPANWA